MDYKAIAEQILTDVGGPENIASYAHCDDLVLPAGSEAALKPMLGGWLRLTWACVLLSLLAPLMTVGRTGEITSRP